MLVDVKKEPILHSSFGRHFISSSNWYIFNKSALLSTSFPVSSLFFSWSNTLSCSWTLDSNNNVHLQVESPCMMWKSLGYKLVLMTIHPTGSTPYLFTKTDLLFSYWNAKMFWTSSLFRIFKRESKPLRITYNMGKLPRYWDTLFSLLFAFFSDVLARPFESVFDQFMVETKFDSFPLSTLYLNTKISSTLFLFLFNCSSTHRHPLRWRSTISGGVTE